MNSFYFTRHTTATIVIELSAYIALVANMCEHKKKLSEQIYAKVSENAKINLTVLMDAI